LSPIPQCHPAFVGALLRLPAGKLFLSGREGAAISGLVPSARTGGNEQEMALSGEWTVLQDLRRDHKIGDFLVVAPDGWDAFYINSRDGKTLYGDFFLREFLPFIERAYRVRAERAARGITGFSMGGYGALRIGFAHPELFGSVSAHSAALMRDPPQGVNAGASGGNLAAMILTNVSGIPSTRNSGPQQSLPAGEEKLCLACQNENLFDCGTEDSYGFDRGASEMTRRSFPENLSRIPSLPGRAQRFLSPRPPGSLVRIPLARVRLGAQPQGITHGLPELRGPVAGQK